MIGAHGPRQVRNTQGMKRVLEVGTDEAFTALEESFYDLEDRVAHAFVVVGRNNIAWIVMHSLQVLDVCANHFQTGHVCFSHDQRWDLWERCQEERPKPGDPFPTVAEMKVILHDVHQAATAGLSDAKEGDLLKKRCADGWWKGNAADAYIRAIFHTMAHVRQIWLIRGVLGLADGQAWPQQHWA